MLDWTANFDSLCFRLTTALQPQALNEPPCPVDLFFHHIPEVSFDCDRPEVQAQRFLKFECL